MRIDFMKSGVTLLWQIFLITEGIVYYKIKLCVDFTTFEGMEVHALGTKSKP
jgi:hypothetical protein